MSTKEILFDDIDGTPATSQPVETILIGIHGKWYRIDVTEENRRLLEATVKPFLDVARPATEAELIEPEFLLDEEDEADEGAFEDGDEDEAPAERSDRDLKGATERNAIHNWLAEQNGTPRKYGPVSKANIALYDAAHAG